MEIFSTKKFSSEINALKSLSGGDVLSAAKLAEIKQKIFSKIRSAEKTVEPKYFWKSKMAKITRYGAVVLVGLSLVAGTAFAANGSVPGSILYPIKRIKEKVELNLAVSAQAKANLQAKFAQTRLDELEILDKNARGAGPVAVVLPGQVPDTALGSATATPATFVVDQNQQKIIVAARAEAGAEVGSALDSLKKVHDKLQNSGNIKAAAAIQTNILNLQARADRLNIRRFGDDNKNNK